MSFLSSSDNGLFHVSPRFPSYLTETSTSTVMALGSGLVMFGRERLTARGVYMSSWECGRVVGVVFVNVYL